MLIELFSKLSTLAAVGLDLAAMSRYDQGIVMYALECVFGYLRQETLVEASVIIAAMSRLGLVSPWC